MENRKPDSVYITVRKAQTGVVRSFKPKEILNELKNNSGVHLGIAKTLEKRKEKYNNTYNTIQKNSQRCNKMKSMTASEI